MDSSNVLTALEELEKWQARRVKIEKRLAAIRGKRAALVKDLGDVSGQLSRMAEALFEPGARDSDAPLLPPFELGR